MGNLMMKHYSFEPGNSMKRSKSELNLKDNSLEPNSTVKTIFMCKRELLLSDHYNVKG